MGLIIRIKETWEGRKAHLEIWIRALTIREGTFRTGMLQEDKEPIWFITKSGPDHHLRMTTKSPNKWNYDTRSWRGRSLSRKSSSQTWLENVIQRISWGASLVCRGHRTLWPICRDQAGRIWAWMKTRGHNCFDLVLVHNRGLKHRNHWRWLDLGRHMLIKLALRTALTTEPQLHKETENSYSFTQPVSQERP